ncbi:MAG: TetR/AcrR family transcriptional regulator [Elusimicrobia bacterium]|nr:TetR/AcrR family transcriptional regulator [Candidatus Obscuribacterium magneticum]
MTKLKRSEIPVIRRHQILKAAKKLLARQGYHDLRLDDVAHEANVAKGTLYLYFKDKENLVLEVMANLFDSLEKSVSAQTKAHAADPLKCLKTIIHEELAFFEKNKDFLMQTAHIRSHLIGRHSGNLLRERLVKHVTFVSGFLKKGIKAGLLKPHGALTGALFLTALIRTFMMKRMIEGPVGIRKTSEQLLRLFLHGLGKSGRKK